ncbi:hypothetical protein ACIBCD_31865 [Nocardia brasiliensis]|uniref:hypothetical protein n=1 Tax=Nocardia brasiliensis TaxID=37326 RepID=UPI0037A83CD3
MEYVVPLSVGIIASLLAPIVQSAMQAFVQDRVARWQRRRDLVDEWRHGIADADDSLDAVADIRATRWYESLRPYLGEELRKRFEHGYGPEASVTIAYLPGQAKIRDLREHRNMLAERVDELARKWKVD